MEQSSLAVIPPLVPIIGVSITGLMALWFQIQCARLFTASAESLLLLLSVGKSLFTSHVSKCSWAPAFPHPPVEPGRIRAPCAAL